MPSLQRLLMIFVLVSCAVFSSGAARANPILLVDALTNEVLYAQEAGQPWHPASLTKLMTAYVTFAAIAAGRVSLDTKVSISRHAWNQAPSKSGLEIGETVTMMDALYITLVQSANDMAVAVAETVSGSEPKFVEEMNAMAEAMGLTATHYVNANGLHNKAQVTSARDLAMLGLYIRRDYPQYLPIFGTEAVTLNASTLTTNNGLLTHFRGTTGMKTGFVCSSGLNIVATVERNGRSLLAVVLGGVSARERNEMAAEVILRELSGTISGTGQSVVGLANDSGAAPTDMRPLICGKQAKEYVAKREKAFPMGLKGQPSNLTDDVVGATYAATDLGVLVDVPMPRPRPRYAPSASVALAQ